jgi:high-affinity iron transporter
MIVSFLITFRETLEAALIVGIILGYLVKTRRTRYNNVVYIGVVSAIVASIIGALLFKNVAGGFTGTAEQVFEGITMLVGAALLTTMILWMMKQKHIAIEFEKRVETELTEAHRFGLFSLVFIAVFREGIETVIFLGAASFVSTNNNLIGALAGIVAATLLGYAIFIASLKINIKRFFNVTSILLILFAGSILKGLFGYNGNPSLIELLGYFVYLGLVLLLWRHIETTHGTKQIYSGTRSKAKVGARIGPHH